MRARALPPAGGSASVPATPLASRMYAIANRLQPAAEARQKLVAIAVRGYESCSVASYIPAHRA
jgi:hypothetical protein